MPSSKKLKSRYYVDMDDSNLNYPYNCVDVLTNEVVWNFEFEDDALEWCQRQNKKLCCRFRNQNQHRRRATEAFSENQQKNRYPNTLNPDTGLC